MRKNFGQDELYGDRLEIEKGGGRREEGRGKGEEGGHFQPVFWAI